MVEGRIETICFQEIIYLNVARWFRYVPHYRSELLNQRSIPEGRKQ